MYELFKRILKCEATLTVTQIQKPLWTHSAERQMPPAALPKASFPPSSIPNPGRRHNLHVETCECATYDREGEPDSVDYAHLGRGKSKFRSLILPGEHSN